MSGICGGVIDWGATGSMLQGVGTLIGAIAVVGGAYYAGELWKKQKIAERRFEIAERILTATYKGRSALSFVRSPMMWGHELSKAERKLEEDSAWGLQENKRKERLITAQAYYNRLSLTKDEQLALEESLPMAKALFNEKLENALQTLRRQFWLVQVNVDSHIDDGGHNPDFTKKIRRGMYDVALRDGEKNEITEAISESVRIIEDICVPALKLQSKFLI